MVFVCYSDLSMLPIMRCSVLGSCGVLRSLGFALCCCSSSTSKFLWVLFSDRNGGRFGYLKRVFSCRAEFVEFAGREFGQIPLVSVVVVVIDVIPYGFTNFGDGCAGRNIVSDMIFEPAKKALHRRIVPAASSTGHALYKVQIGQDALEGMAGIMAALVAVYNGGIAEFTAVVPIQLTHRLDHKFHFQRVAYDPRQDLLRRTGDT